MFFFFFQAEDGIRDVAVTGVQTCALPILFTTQRRDAVTSVLTRVDLAPRPHVTSRKNAQHAREHSFASDRKSTRLNSSHGYISYAVFCLKKKKKTSYYSL